MVEQHPENLKDFIQWCEAKGIKTIAAGTADTNGTWIGKRVPLEDFVTVADDCGLAFSDVLFVITRDGLDVVEPDAGHSTYFPNKESGYPDVFFKPDFKSARLLSWHESTAGITGAFETPDGCPVPIGPRAVLQKQIAKAAELGVHAKFASEFEFYVYCGTADAIRESGYELTPLSSRPYTYSIFRSGMDDKLLSRWRAHLEGAGVHVEALSPENGPGQYELNTRYTDVAKAADDAFFFKNGIKEMACMEGLTASFMAIPGSDLPGSSCHIHQSLWDVETGEPLLPEGRHGREIDLSEKGRHYLAGMLATMRDFTALFWPTVNSYKRARDYSWAGTTVSWGMDNRSVGVRIVGETPKAYRLEHRMAGADVNPYLAFSACLSGGLHGLENRLELQAPTRGDAYADSALTRLPSTLDEALALLEGSAVANDCFGPDFISHYVKMKRYEAEKFALSVTDWEVANYFETA